MGTTSAGDKQKHANTSAVVDTGDQSSSDSSSATSEHPIDFSSFIISLATQALVQLGQMKAPPGIEIKPDRESARQTIDILSLLQLKTKGNLDPAEAQLFEEILHSLRMAYVRGK